MKQKENSQISKITKAYLENRFSVETEKKAQQWLIDGENSEAKECASSAYWETLNTNADSYTYKALKRVVAKIGLAKSKPIVPFYRHLLKIAAVVIPALIFAGGTYYFSQKEQLIQIATVYGETKLIILPDSSEVWLNSGSNIQYPSEFKNSSRKVRLEGEAYFSVQKDASKPFVVNTSNLSVRVIGTEFNIKAYTNDNKTIATLNKGIIEVKTAANQSKILEPCEQLTYYKKTSEIYIQEVPANDISAWKSGQLVFRNTPFDEILKTLERRFNISVESENIGSSEQGYTVKFLKNDDLENILTILKELVGGFSYQIEESKIKIISTK